MVRKINQRTNSCTVRRAEFLTQKTRLVYVLPWGRGSHILIRKQRPFRPFLRGLIKRKDV